jgi:hypothetical protein
VRLADPIGWKKDDRMIRRVFTAASILSLLLCATTAALWVRSHYRVDVITREAFQTDRQRNGYPTAYAMSENGAVAVDVVRDSSIASRLPCSRWTGGSDPAEQLASNLVGSPLGSLNGGVHGVHLGRYGFRYDKSRGGVPFWDEYKVVVPYWALVIPNLLLPGLWTWRRIVRAQRVPKNHCQNCGYDLRASTERCPECGTPIPSTGRTTV